MIEIFSEQLWLGNAMDARDPKPIMDLEIAAVVDVALEEPIANLPRRLVYCRVPIRDGPGNDIARLVQAMRVTIDLLESKTRTLVACSAGVSRSPTIAAFALAMHCSQDPKAMIEQIAANKRLDLNGLLWQEAEQAYSQLQV